ncbi:transmembrane protein 132D [Engraulis encrasicolus]|uniref:transmembrane protein 132D n=1 Tax=Engraulis encrasicolus TaxID=184585 RepID=UPI002FD02828
MGKIRQMIRAGMEPVSLGQQSSAQPGRVTTISGGCNNKMGLLQGMHLNTPEDDNRMQKSLEKAESELDSQELLGDPDSVPPFPVFLPAGFQVSEVADFLFLKEAGQDIMRNSSMRSSTQALLVGRAGRLPLLNVTYGPLWAQRPLTPDLLGQPVPLFRPSPDTSSVGWRVRWHVLSRRVSSLAPRLRVLFYVAGRGWERGERQTAGTGAVDRLPCVTVFAFFQTQEVRASCQLTPRRGTCLASLDPPARWFNPAEASSSSRERLSMEAPPPAAAARGNTVELYYQARPRGVGGGGGGGGGRWRERERVQLRAEYVPVTPMTRIGSVRLLQEAQGSAAPVTQLRLGGEAIVIQTSSKPLKQTDIATFYVLIRSTSLLDTFTLRATLKKGVSFRTARPSNTLLWDTTMDTSADGTIAVICQQRSGQARKRPGGKLLEILQMDLEVEELLSTQAESQLITWQLVLPADARPAGLMEGTMCIYTTQRDFIGLAPLVQDTEILNTAMLTGKRVAVPVRTVAVEADGSVTDVSDFTDCSSTDEDVLKVSDRCDYVYVNGKEQRGRVRMMVNFTYSYLSAQLEMSVWVPRLPLQIELSDNELSQIKGWRIPIQPTKRLGWSSDEDERKGKGCMLQFQHALVRVVTHFVAEQAEAGRSPGDPSSSSSSSSAIFLGSDWQVDVTKLVRYFMKVEDTRVARLQAGRILAGKDMGTTKIQVFSPLSDSILAERTVRVLEDRVSITELGLQLVSGLSLSLQLSPGSNRAVLATATTQEELTSLKQEAVSSAWLQFTDGSLTPLDFYDPTHYRLSVTSLDEGVVSVQGKPPAVTVVAEGEGQGALVRIEMGICEACHKFKRKTVLAIGLGVLKVKFQTTGNSRGDAGGGNGNGTMGTGTGLGGGGGGVAVPGRDGGSDYGNDGEEVAEAGGGGGGGGEKKQPGGGGAAAAPVPGTEQDIAASSPSEREREESAMRKLSTTTKPTVINPDAGGGVSSNSSRGVGKASGNLVNFPNLGDVPYNDNKKTPGSTNEDDSLSADNPLGLRTLTDLEIGMYALLGVFCLAILVFMVNCSMYLVKFRHKQLPVQISEPAGHHRHDWVWLGTDAELVMSVPGSPMQQSQHLLHHHHGQQATTVIDIDRTDSLSRRGHGQCHLQAMGSPTTVTTTTTSNVPSGSVMVGGCHGTATLGRRPAPARSESLNSPTTRRKRVQFTTFGSLDRQSPQTSLRENGNGGIHWVGKEEVPGDCGVPGCNGGVIGGGVGGGGGVVGVGGAGPCEGDGEIDTQVPHSDSLEQL